MEMNFLTALLVFLATAVSDVLWAFYVRRTSSGQAVQAALTSFIIVILGGLIVLEYVENKWYLLPAALGAFLGTLITVGWDVKRGK